VKETSGNRHERGYRYLQTALLETEARYAPQGDTAKARAAYNEFFTLWKDADPDIPICSKPRPSTRSYSESCVAETYSHLMESGSAFEERCLRNRLALVL
jgi:hypothetical protein